MDTTSMITGYSGRTTSVVLPPDTSWLSYTCVALTLSLSIFSWSTNLTLFPDFVGSSLSIIVVSTPLKIDILSLRSWFVFRVILDMTEIGLDMTASYAESEFCTYSSTFRVWLNELPSFLAVTDGSNDYYYCVDTLMLLLVYWSSIFCCYISFYCCWR